MFVALFGGRSGVRRLGGDLVHLDMNQSGFVQRGPTMLGTFDTYYVAPDCTGTPLFPVNFGSTDEYAEYVFNSGIFGSVAYYVPGPAVTLSTASRLVPTFTPSDCSSFYGTMIPGGCCQPFPYTVPMGLAPFATFDLSTLGLVPPFHIEGP